MSRKGTDTREKILDSAHQLTLLQGFPATTLDQILAKADITKGAFFYYFKSKADLAHALVQRYVDMENQLLNDFTARAEKLSRDPLQQILLIVAFFEEMFEGMSEPHPGCLFGSFCYQNDLTSDNAMAMIAPTVYAWRRTLHSKLTAAAALHPPRIEVDLEDVADMFLTIFEGAFIMSRLLQDAPLIVRQLRNYRHYLELLLAPAN